MLMIEKDREKYIKYVLSIYPQGYSKSNSIDGLIDSIKEIF